MATHTSHPEPTSSRAGRRHRLRERVVALLFARHLHNEPGEPLDATAAPPAPPAGIPDADEREAQALAQAIATDSPRIDALIEAASTKWRTHRMLAIDLAILRLGVYELTAHRDTPPAVVINEAVELARTFGDVDSHRFVNAILDTVRRNTAAP